MTASNGEYELPYDILAAFKASAEDGLPNWTDGPTRVVAMGLVDEVRELRRGRASAADDELRCWLVPEGQRPTCPVSKQPCTSWTCLIDVCSPTHTKKGKTSGS